ncbi:hypothetical protein F4560_003266 [Saccharothrix ecbatanensis]|uniref:Ricin B lectin domain-containing protein n=1 Tax=Saccharothrix ecbatanensis TaxID=1105145 RepID=A0A7W9HKB6_9PSEU|nr:nucleoside hydrolase-like domain-containing protein [Saccharothrix ecbatanensis]MBB5803498.1 hypothetical protein [Saccharothrix ecbatanensis]
MAEPTEPAEPAAVAAVAAVAKPRVIAMTDGEVDDKSSMIRFLMYSSDFDVAGIVQTNSRYQVDGHSDEKWVEAQIDQYAKVLPNLRVHKSGYPDAEDLRDVLRVGNENSDDLWVAPPDMATKDTPGEKLIISTLLDDDPRPVHVQAWGGVNTLASALWRLKTYHSAADFTRATAKLRAYAIWYQDGGGGWIEDNIRQAHIYEANQWHRIWDYQSLTGPNPDTVKDYMTEAWLNSNVKDDHGPLGAMYPQSYVSEGDSPSFLHQVDNGLYSHEDYTLGGWGGRGTQDDPVGKPNHLTDTDLKDDDDANKMFWRWIPAAQNDFAARMDWSVASTYKAANHQPNAAVVGSLRQVVAPGQAVKLDATPSTDPDGNTLSFRWWQYHDADSATARVTVNNATSRDNANFVVPDEPGRQIHMIVEVRDNGAPSLTSYQRIVFTIQGEPERLVSKHSGKVLDVQNPNTSDGAKVGQWTWNGKAWQQWEVRDSGGGYVNLVSRHSGKCLDVLGASQANGADIVQWACNGATNQQWQVIPVDGGVQLRARHSGKCADVYEWSTADGATIKQWTCHGGNNQRWQRESV